MIITENILRDILSTKYPKLSEEAISLMICNIHDQCGHFEDVDENIIILGGSYNELLQSNI